jgi:hypothetical protein
MLLRPPRTRADDLLFTLAAAVDRSMFHSSQLAQLLNTSIADVTARLDGLTAVGS